MACLRLFTMPPLPPLPERRVPRFSRRMALATVFAAALPYLRRLDFFLAGIIDYSRTLRVVIAARGCSPAQKDAPAHLWCSLRPVHPPASRCALTTATLVSAPVLLFVHPDYVAGLAAIAVVAASHFASAVPLVVSSLRVSADGAAVAAAPDGLRPVVCAEAVDARLAEDFVAWEQAHFGLVPADYSAAELADGLNQGDLAQAHLAQADCSVATQAVDSIPADYSAEVDLAPADLPLDDCWVEAQAVDSVLADYSAAVGSVAGERWAVVDLVPADLAQDGCSVAPQVADSVPADYSAAQRADDHSVLALLLDDCSAAVDLVLADLVPAGCSAEPQAVDLVPADLVPAGCLAGPQAADSAPVDYSAA